VLFINRLAYIVVVVVVVTYPTEITECHKKEYGFRLTVSRATVLIQFTAGNMYTDMY